MSVLAFYEVGCDRARGPRAALVLARRLLRRILRPMFGRLVEILQAICHRLDAADRADAALRADLDRLGRRHEHLADQLQATLAFGWDYVAMVRRLAALEDRVEALTARAEAAGGVIPAPHVRAHAPHAAVDAR